MSRTKIENLPVLEDLSTDEKKSVAGGTGLLLPAVQAAREAADDGDTDTASVGINESITVGASKTISVGGAK